MENRRFLLKPILLSLLLSKVSSASWKDGYYRGVGQASFCSGSDTLISGRCYPVCPTGWTLVGTSCTSDCPIPWSGTGTTCSNNGGTYGRGWGHTSNGGCLGGGESYLDPSQGCEQCLLLHYPVCGYGYYNSGCNICTYGGGCPPSMSSAGSGVCSKASTPQSSTPALCNPGLVLASDNLCYPSCMDGFDGTNICWRQGCPATEPNTCNQALCTANSACSAAETTATNSVLSSIATSITNTGQFNMEDIVRGLGASVTSVAGGMSYQQTFASQDADRALPYLCNKRRFPIFLGATGGETFINTFEFDLNLNIAVACFSTDPLFVSTSTGRTFLGILEKSGFNFTWMAEIASSTQQVKQLAFSPDGNQLAALLQSSPLTLLIFNSGTGSMISQVKDTASQFQTNGISLTVDPSTAWITLALADPSSNLHLLGLNLFNNPTISSPLLSVLRITANQIPWSAVNGEPGTLYIGSYSNLPAQGFSISEFTMSLTSTTWVATYVSSWYNSQNYLPKKMSYSNFGLPNNAIYLAADSGSGGIMIVRRQLMNNLVNSYVYQEHNNDPLQTMDILPFNFNGVFVIIKNTFRDTLFTLTLNYGISSLTISKKLQLKPFVSQTDSMYARLVINGDYYIAGRIMSFGQNPICVGSTGNKKGFIASTERDALTQTFTFVDQMSSPTFFYSAVPYQTFQFPYNSLSLSLSQTGSATIPIVQNNLYQVQNTCNMKTVTTTVMLYHRYIIDYPPETYKIDRFTLTPQICTDWFDFSYRKGSTITIPTSPVVGEAIFFDDVKLTFKAETSDSTHAGIYQVRVQSLLPNHQVDIGTYFPIELFNIPPSTQIFGQPMNDQTYIVTDKRLNFTCTPFLSSDLQYYIIYYIEIYDTKLQSWSRNLDPQIMNFTQGGKLINPTVYASNNSQVGVYDMRLVGKFTPNTAFKSISQFKFIVQHQCYLTTVYPSDDLPDEVTYYMGYPPSSQKVFGFSHWSDKLGICAPFSYKATFEDGNSLPDFISFNPILRQFVITQTKSMVPGTYSIVLRGSLSNYYISATQSFKVLIKCSVGTLKTSQTDQRINFIAGSPILQLTVGEFLQTPSCGKEIIYQASMESGASLNAKYLSFEQSSNSLGIYDRTLTFQAPTGSPIKQFNVIVKAIINQDGEYQKRVMSTLTYKFNVIDDNQYTETTYPDIAALIKAGDSWMIPFVKMPKSSDQGLRQLQGSSVISVTFTKQVLKLISGEISANSGQLLPTDQPNVQYDESTGMLIATPKQNTEHGTQYVIRAEIIDAKKFKITQDIALTVYKNGGGGVEDFEQMMKQLLELQQQSFSQLNAKRQEETVWGRNGKNMSVTSKPDLDFKMRIAKVDQYGLVTVRFNKPLVILQNISLIDSQVLTVFVTSFYKQQGQNFDQRNLNFTWQIQEMVEKQITIQLFFQNPLSISTLEVLDTLKISVNQSEFFITQQPTGAFSPIPKYTSSSKKVPPQSSSSDTQLLKSVKSFSNTIFSMLFANALISVLLSSSISSLWSLIHVSQLMMTIPLMNIQLPASAQTVFLTMQNIISFDFVDTNQIPLYNWFLEFPDEDAEEAFDENVTNEISDEYTGSAYNQRFELYGYEYKNNVRNMGSGFVWFALSIFYQGMIYIVWRFFQSVEVSFKRIETLQKSVFFTMIISTFYEGTLEMTICGMVNVLNPEWTNNTEYFSTIFSIVVLISIALILIISFIVAQKVPNKQGKKSFKRLSTLYEGLKTKERDALFYTPISMIRRIAIVLSVMFLPTLLQTLLFMAQSAYTVAYLLKYQPFKDRKIMRLEIFNECMLLLCANLTLGFVTDIAQISTPEAISMHGWVLSGVMLFTVFVNTMIATIEQIQGTWASIKKGVKRVRKWLKERKERTVQLQPINAGKLDFGQEQVQLDSFFGNSPIEEDQNIRILKAQYRKRRLLKLHPLPAAGLSFFQIKQTNIEQRSFNNDTNSKLFSTTIEDEENKTIPTQGILNFPARQPPLNL